MKGPLVALSLACLSLSLATGVFGQNKNQTNTYIPPKPFVEAPVPDGKALVYVYTNVAITSSLLLKALYPRAGILVLAKTEPVGVLHASDYRIYVAEPGTVKLWVIGAGDAASDCIFQADAGEAYFVIADNGPDIKLVKKEKAKSDLAGRVQNTD